MRKSEDKPKTEDVSGRGLSGIKAFPLAYDRPAGPQIFEAMKLAIMHMDIPPGSLISEADIGALFGASRTPVREAFSQLRAAGLIVTRPSRGNFVTKLSEKRVLESRYLRSAIEMANIRHLCTHGLSDGDKLILQDLLDRQKSAIERNAIIEFQNLDDLFHFKLASATGFTRAADLLENEKMNLDRLRVFSLRDRPHMLGLYEQHRQIFDALCRRDTDQALHEMQQHLHSILATLSTMARDHSEYFE